MPHMTSTDIAGRIEDLYGLPLADLTSHAETQPPGMLAALLAMHHDLALAEGSIAVQRDRLTQLVHPDRQIGPHEMSHVLDCTRRLAAAVTVRDVQARTAQAVLQSLGRVAEPEPAAAPALPALTPPVANTGALRSR
ncbi:hypothetical protein J8N05_45660 [Streptomyces sp. BH-SS-21]|uniref:Uncharacterized protein n=1 Tax=Streptomyces liliiviolaceus TaxID=2823109 RepID=A0A940YEH7_9ACTN|nr:hypothetical protein [Streptomyces liliiviolaceus]MBQ0855459.1 hypothetical protein [Streptomyces liliiviolaceus]